MAAKKGKSKQVKTSKSKSSLLTSPSRSAKYGSPSRLSRGYVEDQEMEKIMGQLPILDTEGERCIRDMCNELDSVTAMKNFHHLLDHAIYKTKLRQLKCPGSVLKHYIMPEMPEDCIQSLKVKLFH